MNNDEPTPEMKEEIDRLLNQAITLLGEEGYKEEYEEDTEYPSDKWMVMTVSVERAVHIVKANSPKEAIDKAKSEHADSIVIGNGREGLIPIVVNVGNISEDLEGVWESTFKEEETGRTIKREITPVNIPREKIEPIEESIKDIYKDIISSRDDEEIF